MHVTVLSAAVSAGFHDGAVEEVRVLLPPAFEEFPCGRRSSFGFLIGDAIVDYRLSSFTLLSCRLMVVPFPLNLAEDTAAEGVLCAAGVGLGGMMGDVWTTLVVRITCRIMVVNSVDTSVVLTTLNKFA